MYSSRPPREWKRLCRECCVHEKVRVCVCVSLYEICSIAGYIDDSMVSGCDCTASPVTSAMCYWWYPSARWMRIPPPASTQGPLKDKRDPVCCLTDLPTVFCLSHSYLPCTASCSPWSLCFLAHTNVSEMDINRQIVSSNQRVKSPSKALCILSAAKYLSSLDRPCGHGLFFLLPSLLFFLSFSSSLSLPQGFVEPGAMARP